jgi:hypothetical protein
MIREMQGGEKKIAEETLKYGSDCDTILLNGS